MVSVNDVYGFMNELAPVDTAESWDNVGLLVGRRDRLVTRILCALDITPQVIAEADEKGAQLIVSHHPLIWDTYKFVNDTVFQQEKVLTLVEKGIAAICMHTNLDLAEDGVDDTLVEALGLNPLRHLGEDGIGHVCELKEKVPLKDFLSAVKAKLGANGLRYCDAGKPVKRIATGCGSCGSYLMDAVKAGCDTFVTGDVKYSTFLDALGCGVNLIDAGHFSTENPVVEKLAGKLREHFPELIVETAHTISQPDQFFVG